ncbi:MAG TPA: hypothetical protein DDZ51_23390 [Planctomycetaceae bacterium]|nr:hypothetical protein [Planctomycetaceae bacterium]
MKLSIRDGQTHFQVNPERLTKNDQLFSVSSPFRVRNLSTAQPMIVRRRSYKNRNVRNLFVSVTASRSLCDRLSRLVRKPASRLRFRVAAAGPPWLSLAHFGPGLLPLWRFPRVFLSNSLFRRE